MRCVTEQLERQYEKEMEMVLEKGYLTKILVKNDTKTLDKVRSEILKENRLL